MTAGPRALCGELSAWQQDGGDGCTNQPPIHNELSCAWRRTRVFSTHGNLESLEPYPRVRSLSWVGSPLCVGAKWLGRDRRGDHLDCSCLLSGRHPNRRVKGWGVRKSTVITGPINVWHLSQVVGTSRATSLGGADGKGGEMGQMANGRRRREDIPRPDSHIHRVWGEHAGPPPPGHAAQWGLTGSGFLRGPVHRRRIGVRPGSPSADRKAGHHFGFPRQP